MPSNQLPEDVRDRFSEVLLEHSVDRYLDYRQGGGQVCECGETLMGALPFAEHQLDAIAPLIIEWARKDQAEKDRQIAWDIAQVQYNKGRTDVAFGANQVCEALTCSPTPETGQCDGSYRCNATIHEQGCFSGARKVTLQAEDDAGWEPS